MSVTAGLSFAGHYREPDHTIVEEIDVVATQGIFKPGQMKAIGGSPHAREYVISLDPTQENAQWVVEKSNKIKMKK